MPRSAGAGALLEAEATSPCSTGASRAAHEEDGAWGSAEAEAAISSDERPEEDGIEGGGESSLMGDSATGERTVGAPTERLRGPTRADGASAVRATR